MIKSFGLRSVSFVRLVRMNANSVLMPSFLPGSPLQCAFASMPTISRPNWPNSRRRALSALRMYGVSSPFVSPWNDAKNDAEPGPCPLPQNKGRVGDFWDPAHHPTIFHPSCYIICYVTMHIYLVFICRMCRWVANRHLRRRRASRRTKKRRRHTLHTLRSPQRLQRYYTTTRRVLHD